MSCMVDSISAGAAIDLEYIAGQQVMKSVKPMPTDSFIATSEAVTIGDALEGAALIGNRPVGQSDARAIQSAVMWATGAPPAAGGWLQLRWRLPISTHGFQALKKPP